MNLFQGNVISVTILLEMKQYLRFIKISNIFMVVTFVIMVGLFMEMTTFKSQGIFS